MEEKKNLRAGLKQYGLFQASLETVSILDFIFSVPVGFDLIHLGQRLFTVIFLMLFCDGMHVPPLSLM